MAFRQDRTLLKAMLLVAVAASAAAAAPLEPALPSPEVQGHLTAAAQAAGPAWASRVAGLCRLRPIDRPDPVAAVIPGKPIPPPPPGDWQVPPRKIFDNLYFIGSTTTSTFALTTPEGVIVLDGQGNIDRDGSIVPGLRALGLDPARIRYVIIPHGHPDHYGGARYLHDAFGAKVVAPANDMGVMRYYTERVTVLAPKKIDVPVGDGSKLTLGGVTVDILEVAGHTPGGVVLSFPVTDKGAPHRMLIWASGGDGPSKADDLKAQLPGVERLLAYAKAKDVDVLAENHGAHALLAKWTTGSPNPFLVGAAAVQGYLTMRLECDRARLAAIR